MFRAFCFRYKFVCFYFFGPSNKNQKKKHKKNNKKKTPNILLHMASGKKLGNNLSFIKTNKL